MNRLIFLFTISCVLHVTACSSVSPDERLSAQIPHVKTIADIQNEADQLLPLYQKNCVGVDRIKVESACTEINNRITISYLLSSRYKDAALDRLIYQNLHWSGNSRFCGNDINAYYNNYAASVSLNEHQVSFLIGEQNMTGMEGIAKQHVIRAYICGEFEPWISSHITIGDSVKDENYRTPQNFRRFLSKENFYADARKYLGKDGEEQARFFVEQIWSPLCAWFSTQQNQSTDVRTAQFKVIYQHAVDFAEKNHLDSIYIDFLRAQAG